MTAGGYRFQTCIADDDRHDSLLNCQLFAGKSTVLRSLAAVALLANCGLMVPAKTAQVPWCMEVEFSQIATCAAG